MELRKAAKMQDTKRGRAANASRDQGRVLKEESLQYLLGCKAPMCTKNMCSDQIP
jgi:hypothetical protein